MSGRGKGGKGLGKGGAKRHRKVLRDNIQVRSALVVPVHSSSCRASRSRRSVAWRAVVPGAIFATVMWTLASVGFSVYVGSFSSYNETYGALGAAAEFAETVVESEPDNADALVALASRAIRANKRDEAKEYLAAMTPPYTPWSIIKTTKHQV